MKQVMAVSVVNFHTSWGKKDVNLQKILDYMDIAADQGSNLVVFPEMALTGYDVVKTESKTDLMQVKEAETIPGSSTEVVSAKAQELGLYVVFGMPERDSDDPSVVYNSVAIIYPTGRVDSYRKMHCLGDENLWATKGNYPTIIDTPWGPVGVSICYDTYNYPELIRYARGMGGAFARELHGEFY